ncbi:hypothetical protein [Cellulomonas sp. P5_C5]
MSTTGYFRQNASRFQVVVAMWVFVGFFGSLLFASFGLMLVTGTGMFADKASFDPGLEFAPGQEVKISDGTRPGNFMVLAYPATADVSTMECSWKSQVYSTGVQRVGTLDLARPDGVAEALTTFEAPPRSFVPIAATEGTGWMEPDLLTCSGAGVESFAIASARGFMSDNARYGIGAALLVVAPIILGLGFVALHFTRKWHRHGMVPAPSYPGTR